MPGSQIQFYCEYLRTDLLHGLPLLKFKRQVHRSMLSYLCNLCLPTASFSIPAYSHPSPQRLIRSFSPVKTSVLTSCTVLHQGLEAGPGVTHMSNATSFILVHSTIQLLVQSVSLHWKSSEASNATSFILVHSAIQLLVQSVSLHCKSSELVSRFQRSCP